MQAVKAREMRLNVTARKRSPYKRYLTDPDYPVPWQTRYNWRHAAAESDDRGSEDDGESADEGCEDSIELIESEAEDNTDPIESEVEDDNDPIIGEHEFANDRASPTHRSSVLNQGVGLSEEMGMMLVISLASKHRLTYSALADILKVICLHLPADSVPASYKSVYRLLKKMTALGEHTSHQLAHRLCGKCAAYLAGEQGCSEPTCQAVDVQAKDHLFLELPVDTQVRALFQSK